MSHFSHSSLQNVSYFCLFPILDKSFRILVKSFRILVNSVLCFVPCFILCFVPCSAFQPEPVNKVKTVERHNNY